MANKFSTAEGNLLRGDTENRDELRAALHLLASLLARDGDERGSFVLDFERDDETGALINLGLYTYDDFTDLMEEDDEVEGD